MKKKYPNSTITEYALIFFKSILMFGFGFISCKSQNFSIPPIFEKVLPFRHGLAPVCTEGRWGLIDVNGNWVVKPCFTSLKENAKGNFLVERVENDFIELLTIDANAKWTINPFYGYVEKVTTSKGDRFIEQHSSGFILVDEKGMENSSAYDTLVYLGHELWIGHKKYSGDVLIDLQGHELSDYFDEIFYDEFSENFKIKSEGKYGLLGKDGRLILPAEFTLLETVGNHIACSKGGNMHLFSLSLKTLHDFSFDYVLKLNAKFWVARNSNSGDAILFNEEGKVVKSDFTVSDGQYVQDRLPIANKDGQWGYINALGEIVIPCEFRYTETFWENGYAVVWQNRMDKVVKMVIDRTGKEVTTPPFDKLEWSTDGIYRLEYQGKNQLLDAQFKPITKPNKQLIEYVGKGTYILYQSTSSFGVQKWNPYTGAKFKIERYRDYQVKSIHALNGTLLVHGEDFNESDVYPKVSEGWAMAKKGNKWGFIKCEDVGNKR